MFDKVMLALKGLVAVIVALVVIWVYFGPPSDTQPITTPTPSGVHNLQGLSIPLQDNWEAMGDERSMTVLDPNCTNDFGKDCGVLTVVVKADFSDPDEFLRANKDSCEKEAVSFGKRKIGSLSADYYVIDLCVPEPNTSSEEVRYLWHIPGVVTVLLTHGQGKERMAGVNEALAGAVWQ